MSNHFPAIPSDLQLARISYGAVIQPPDPPAAGVLASSSDVFVEASYLNTNNPGDIGYSFFFNVPGAFGTFDQDAVETALKSAITSACQGVADYSGVTLASVQEGVTISRQWIWGDDAGHIDTFSDALAYP